MKKKIGALLLLLVMICGAVLTSCNNSTAIIEEDETRRALTITLYCITDDKTTPEAIQKVEDAINQITKKRYSTQIKLRLYKESEYDNVIDNLVADIALEEKQKADEDAMNASMAKESRRKAAIDKLISMDKAEVTTRKLIVWATEGDDEETEEADYTYETTQNIFGDSVEKYPDATDTQLDIFLICGTENLNKYVTEEPYASDDESFLISMDESLTLNSKAIKQYVNETILLAGKVGNVQYAIPTNKRMADKSTYLILDRALMKKYGYGEDDIRTLTSAKFASYLAQIKENEKDVIPLKNTPDAPGIVSLFGEESIFGTYVANTAVTGFKAAPKNLLSAYQYTDHIIYMEQYKRNGFVAESEDENARYGAQVVSMTEDEAENYDQSKYIVKVLGKGMATTETIGQYMFGISKYTRDANRCMEIITLLSTNSEIRNLLQYGVEGYNYRINGETGRLERINQEYMMNIFATGNTFIAYPEEYMEDDVWEKDKAANRSTIVSPYLGFIFEKEKNADLVEKMKELSKTVLNQVKEFDVEKRRLEKIEELNKELTDYKKEADKYKEQLDLIKDTAESYLNRIEEAKEQLTPYAEALAAAKDAIKPYDKEIESLKAEIKDLEKKISDEEKVKPTEDKPDLAPDQAKIDGWKKEIEEAELNIRAQRGYSYELRKELAEAQAVYDEQNKTVTDIEAEYEALTVTGIDSSGKEVEYPMKTAYNARLNNYNTFNGNVENIQKEIDALTAPAQSKLDKEYAELKALIESSQTEYDQLSEEYTTLNTQAKSSKEQLAAAEEAVKEAKKALEEAKAAYEEKNKDGAVALSYVEDKEEEIAANTDEAKAEQLNKELADLTAAYNKAAAAASAEKNKYESAKATLSAKEAARDVIANSDTFTQIAEIEARMSELNIVLKNAMSEFDGFKTKSYEYYDEIANTLYTEFFKNTVSDLEANNADYQQFMNVGEEQADNENGVVYIYNEWYSSMYGE
ncbi:MAG: hypothetical protein IJT49_05235 [Clostridia bacterium]|nr:hypothetical protein [Clostridia bacterium]